MNYKISQNERDAGRLFNRFQNIEDSQIIAAAKEFIQNRPKGILPIKMQRRLRSKDKLYMDWLFGLIEGYPDMRFTQGIGKIAEFEFYGYKMENAKFVQELTEKVLHLDSYYRGIPINKWEEFHVNKFVCYDGIKIYFDYLSKRYEFEYELKVNWNSMVFKIQVENLPEGIRRWD